MVAATGRDIGIGGVRAFTDSYGDVARRQVLEELNAEDRNRLSRVGVETVRFGLGV